MASNSESGKGARRRTTLIPRAKVNNSENNCNSDILNTHSVTNNIENGRDSGLSSESSTPTGGSPPPRQQKIILSSSTLSNSIVTNREKIDSARYIGLVVSYIFSYIIYVRTYYMYAMFLHLFITNI